MPVGLTGPACSLHRRDYNPEAFTAYESRNGVNPEREKERALLVFAHYKEDTNDAGRSLHGWVKLEDLMRDLNDSELNVLHHYMQNNPNTD